MSRDRLIVKPIPVVPANEKVKEKGKDARATAINGWPKVSVPGDKHAASSMIQQTKEKETGKDEVRHRLLIERPSMQMANERARALRDRQANHLVSRSN